MIQSVGLFFGTSMELFPARQLNAVQFVIVANSKWQIDVDAGLFFSGIVL